MIQTASVDVTQTHNPGTHIFTFVFTVVCICVYIFVYGRLPLHLSFCLPDCKSICTSACLSVGQPVHLSASVHLSVHSSVYLGLRFPVCFSSDSVSGIHPHTDLVTMTADFSGTDTGMSISLQYTNS